MGVGKMGDSRPWRCGLDLGVLPAALTICIVSETQSAEAVPAESTRMPLVENRE